MVKNFELQADLLSMYKAFLKIDHGTFDMDEVDVDGLYGTLENFEKFVDKLLRDFIKFSIQPRGKTQEELLDELLDKLSDVLDKADINA